MDPPKEEPQPAKLEPQTVKSEPTEADPASSSIAPRGRGRGRARGRGRRVVPRSVPRRKPREAPKAVLDEGPDSDSKRRGRGRGRGRGSDRGRGADRGRGQRAPTHAPNAVGLGQIAPVRPTMSRVASSGSSHHNTTSKKSSAVSSMSVGPPSSLGSFGRYPISSSSDPGAMGGTMSIETGLASLGDPEEKTENRASKMQDGLDSLFVMHTEVEEDSDDDMPDDSFELRNRDIAPYAGHLTSEGLLLPVSLPGLRSLPPQFREFEDDAVDKDKPISTVAPDLDTSTKNEPMEVDTDVVEDNERPRLDANMFPMHTVAYKLLSSDSSLAFMQLPGLLPLSQKTPTSRSKGSTPSKSSSSGTNAERARGLGVDLRLVGQPGETQRLGKLRVYRSGRVQMVMENGGTMDLEDGIKPKVCQQVVVMNSEARTCQELQNSISSRLVAVPEMSDGPF